jgi:hypothetical protein
VGRDKAEADKINKWYQEGYFLKEKREKERICKQESSQGLRSNPAGANNIVYSSFMSIHF